MVYSRILHPMLRQVDAWVQKREMGAYQPAAERPGSVEVVVGFTDGEVQGGIGHHHGDVTLSQAIAELRNQQAGDVAQLRLRERVENNELVKAVQELRAEVALAHVEHRLTRVAHEVLVEQIFGALQIATKPLLPPSSFIFSQQGLAFGPQLSLEQLLAT